jgi:hypothetical protein
MTITKSFIIDYLVDYYRTHNKVPTILNINHPFSYFHVKKHFDTWNNALTEAGLPLNRYEIIITQCKLCQEPIAKQHKEIIRSNNDFCNHKCAAIYNNTGRKMSEATKEKIRQKLMVIRFTKCKICSIKFEYRKRRRQTCSDKCLSDLKKRINKKKKHLIFDSDSD